MNIPAVALYLAEQGFDDTWLVVGLVDGMTASASQFI
jgi:hypothetical protein